MKKNLFLFILLFLLCSCTNNSQESNNVLKTLFNDGKCEEIISSTIKEKCYTKQAIINGDFNLCNKLPDSSRDTCLKEMAIKSENLQVCDKIESEIFSTSCRVSVSKDISFCNFPNNQQKRESCLTKYAGATSNSLICAKEIKTKFYKDNCFVAVAVARNDKKLCSSAQELIKKD